MIERLREPGMTDAEAEQNYLDKTKEWASKGGQAKVSKGPYWLKKKQGLKL